MFLHKSYLANEIDPVLHSSFDAVKFDVEIASDVINERLIAIRTLSPLQAGNRFPSKQVYLFVGTGSYFLNAKGVFTECLEPRRIIPFPDPLSLGAGYYLESTMFYPFDEVTRSLHTAHSDMRAGFKVNRNGPITSFHRRNEHISFDTSKDCVPVEVQHEGDETGAQFIQGRTKHILTKGVWLPETVSYITNKRVFLHMELDWVSVNEPLPAGLFERDTLERLFSAKDANDLLSK